MVGRRLKVRGKDNCEMKPGCTLPEAFGYLCYGIILLIVIIYLISFIFAQKPLSSLCILLTVGLLPFTGIYLFCLQIDYYSMMNHVEIVTIYRKINPTSDDVTANNHIRYIEYEIEKLANDNRIAKKIFATLPLVLPMLKFETDTIGQEKDNKVLAFLVEMIKYFGDNTLLIVLLAELIFLVVICYDVRRLNDIEDTITKLSLDFYFKHKEEIKDKTEL